MEQRLPEKILDHTNKTGLIHDILKTRQFKSNGFLTT